VQRRRQIVGWLSVIAGYGLTLLLIRGVFLGVTRGFGAARSQAPWILLGYLLFFALAIYLFSSGRRNVAIARGIPQTKPRFGWGWITVGAIFLYSYVTDHFHLTPAGSFKQLEPANGTQAVAMNVTTIVLVICFVLCILSGIRSGFQRSQN
jgi:membrane protease YdiL (CAAX protease family)